MATVNNNAGSGKCCPWLWRGPDKSKHKVFRITRPITTDLQQRYQLTRLHVHPLFCETIRFVPPFFCYFPLSTDFPLLFLEATVVRVRFNTHEGQFFTSLYVRNNGFSLPGHGAASSSGSIAAAAGRQQ